PNFTSPQVIETIEFLYDLIEMQGGHTTVSQMGNRVRAFLAGMRPIIAGNQALFKELTDQNFDLNDLGIGVIPGNDRRPGATGKRITVTGWYLAIPVGLPAAVEDAAFRWVEYMTARADGGAQFAMTMGRPSPLMEVNFHPAYFDINPLW